MDKLGWVNATVSVGHDGQSLLLTAALPATTDADSGGAESAGSDQRGDMAAAPAVLGSAYGWVRETRFWRRFVATRNRTFAKTGSGHKHRIGKVEGKKERRVFALPGADPHDERLRRGHGTYAIQF